MILLIDNYDSFTYNLYQAVAELLDNPLTVSHEGRGEFENILVVRNDKITIEEIKKLKPSGIILSPGPGRPENAGICLELIRSLDSSTPLLGVCLGLQAITMAFGGKVIGAPEIVHGKSDLIFHNRKGIYQNLPLPFEAGRYHSLIADRASLPSSLIIEAENSAGLVMGLRHETLPIYGVQFHPESILTPKGNDLLKNFVEMCTQIKSAA